MGLLTHQEIKNHNVLVVGSSNLTNIRVKTLLSHGSRPIVIAEETPAHPLEGAVYLSRSFRDSDLTDLGRHEVENVVDAVFVTLPPSKQVLAQHISKLCKRLRIPVNVADKPDLCTFTLLSTHSSGDFQLGITTSGKGCRLANRFKRHVVNSLPHNVDTICANVGALRQQIRESDELVGQDDDDAEQTGQLNKLVVENAETYDQTVEERRKQRLRWLSQVVEYYPLESLADISMQDLSQEQTAIKQATTEPVGSLTSQEKKRGKISLVGSGPGSAELLTTGALQAIHSADLILADKLVPEQVLQLIPRGTPVEIAKKFPGNAERAQQELLERGLEGLRQGKHVVRLKQGDPYIFGRGAEEYVFFNSHGYKPQVISGITSALSAPLVANIPATHRNVADQVLFCTGTGRKGVLPKLPEWEPTRTTVFLMALHRIDSVVEALVREKKWDPSVPCCVIERASCPDQRIIRTRLQHVAEAIESAGSRPPGLLVVGYSCEVIEKLSSEKWTIEEGL
ncbi:uroporphyrinogen-III C-methyltransferase [Trichomonascus vanleenenianus]|uniref:uroporphyrinogen-III C-methyltransferase n=1 Tax=Trichomonascus vanleenenianus TaxID=2268995 RepID=UPI003ECA8666